MHFYETTKFFEEKIYIGSFILTRKDESTSLWEVLPPFITI